MAETLLQKLPPSRNKYGIHSINKFYKDLYITTKFQLKQTTEDVILELSKIIEISMAAGIDNVPGRFLKDGAVILAKPVTKICFDIKSGIFPDPCKLTKLKSLFKEDSKMDLFNYRPISLPPSISKMHAFFISSTFISNARLKLTKNQANAKQHRAAEKLFTVFIHVFIHK